MIPAVPTGFTIPVREVRMSAGAGFITPILGVSILVFKKFPQLAHPAHMTISELTGHANDAWTGNTSWLLGSQFR